MPANDSFFRSQNKLHIVYAISCIVLLVSVIWMMAADQADEWRGYQRTNYKLDAAVKEQALKKLRSGDYESKKEQLDGRVAELDTELKAYAALRDELEESRNAARREVDRLELDLKSQNAIRDEARAHFDLAIRDNLPESGTVALKQAFDVEQQKSDAIQLQLDEASVALQQVGTPSADDSEDEEDEDRRRQLQNYAKLVAERAAVEAQLGRLDTDVKLVEAGLYNVAPDSLLSSLKREIMEWPIIDGFNSHLKIQQDWLPALHQTLGMTEIARFDRCRTCHLNIDKTAPGNVAAFPPGHPGTDDVEKWVARNSFPQPFSTHPNHELFATSASPHPVAKFGCTICHDGQGSGTSFGNAEHTPNDPHMAEEWEDEYHWHANHFWEYPMPPQRFMESTCIKCHHDVTELGVHPEFGASAPKVYRGYQLIRKYGCFGCHEIHGFDGGQAIGPDMRLEPQTAEDRKRITDDPTQVSGKFRKVGPSLRHVASKTSADFIAYWTEVPGRFRPSTKMPQFFNLSNQEDQPAQDYEAVELAGIAQFLTGNSEPIDLLNPADGYEANAVRGRQLFMERGCLACHQHGAVEGTTADFGPNISDIHKKVNRNSDDAGFSDWLYTWLKEPERYHPRTKMPNLYLETYLGADGTTTVDPAADIVAFLLSQGAAEKFPTEEFADEVLDDLVTLFLKKSRFSDVAAKRVVQTGRFPQPAKDVVGDEKVLATEDGSPAADAADWRQKKLEYIGRRSVTRYGCYGCHDIPGYESARPIGVALQDWGRKDTSKLGLEHIEEFLHHHGEPDGSSTTKRIEDALAMAEDGTRKPGDPEYDSEMTAAFFYESLLHHGRPGFLWQKLRDPRSYDFMKTETKGYDERLRMPKFPLPQDEIEAIATFVLGLVAEPPAESHVYKPDARDKARIDGEFLLAKYNCTGCHMVELPTVTFGVNVEDDILATELTPQDHEQALDLLLEFRKPKQALTGQTRRFKIDGEEVQLPLASFHGLRMVLPDPEEDPEFRETGFDVMETLDFGAGENRKRLLPSSRLTISDSKLASFKDGRGGVFAEWLVDELTKTRMGGNRNLAWQASPPPLYQEGLKVQTPWLYRWLQEPDQVRYTTVLRMPRFNLSSEDAQSLANYFAAVDGAAFPYQEQKTNDADYLIARQNALRHKGQLKGDEEYLEESWKTLNGPLCIKCHNVGGRRFKVSDPAKDIQGPNLIRVHERLRSDWVKLWLYKPTWITPYTSMPVNFPHNNRDQFPELFEGDPDSQIVGVRDALLNYGRLMENIGPVVYPPPAVQEAADAAAAGSAEDDADDVEPVKAQQQASTGTAGASR